MSKRINQFQKQDLQLTPKKRIKMNQELDSPKLLKKSSSIIYGPDLCVMKDLRRRKNSYKVNTSLFDSVSSPQISKFQPQMDLFAGFGNSNSKSIVNSSQKMFSGFPDSLNKRSSSKMLRSNNPHQFVQDNKIDEQDYDCQDQLNNLMRINRKFTAIEEEDINNDFQAENLSLYRHNSTFNPKISRDDIKYGDNIYIQQIMALKRNESKINRNSSNKQNRMNQSNYNNQVNAIKDSYKLKYKDISSDQDDQNQRLLQDYQIKNNLKHNIAHHQNLICLNKLQRIFYYVKKVQFVNEKISEEENNQILALCRLQVNLSNKDQQYDLLRLYQTWLEKDSIYMIFEIGQFSLEDKMGESIRLPEYQIWSLINGCCKSLNYLHKQGYYHLNIKPGNIIKCRNSYKMSDFYGKIHYLVQQIKKQNCEQNLNIQFPFLAPQLIKFINLLDGINLAKCDIYSLGVCILANILNLGFNPSRKNLEFKKLKKMINRNLQGYSPSLKRMLLRIISSDPQKRPSIQQLIITPDFLQNHKLSDSGVLKISQIKRKLSL